MVHLAGKHFLIFGAYRPEEINIRTDRELNLKKILAEFKRSFGEITIDLVHSTIYEAMCALGDPAAPQYLSTAYDQFCASANLVKDQELRMIYVKKINQMLYTQDHEQGSDNKIFKFAQKG
jgi:hypothetical protein